MKKAIAVAAVLLLGFAISFADESEKRPRLISVTGIAEVHAVPDQVLIQIGVESRDRELAAAKSQHDGHMKEVLRVVREAGIEDRDVHTSQLSMEPDYPDNKWRATPSGYQVSQSVSITLKDLSHFDSLVTALLLAGTNRVMSVNFGIADPSRLRAEARAKAIKAAKEKAATMAGQLDQTLGKPWEIVEVTNEWPTTVAQIANTSFGYNDRTSNSGVTVSPGEITVREQVRVSFELQ